MKARYHRTSGYEADTFERDATEPHEAGAHLGVVLTGTKRGQPAEGTLHRDRQGIDPPTGGETETGVQFPPVGWCTTRFQSGGQLVVRLRCGTARCRPHHDLTLCPRAVKLDLVGFEQLEGGHLLLHRRR